MIFQMKQKTKFWKKDCAPLKLILQVSQIFNNIPNVFKNQLMASKVYQP